MTTLCHRLSHHTPLYQNPLYGDHWGDKETEVKKYVYSKVLVDGCIKKGTTLYHGTTNPSLSLESLDPTRAMYFGLEPMISLWYTLEESERKKEIGKGYIYKYKTMEEIPIDRYIERIREHPGEECCVHPQVVLRGYDNYHACMGPFDLSIEVTLLKEQREKIRLLRVYQVDVKNLQELIALPVRELRLIKYKDEMKVNGMYTS